MITSALYTLTNRDIYYSLFRHLFHLPRSLPISFSSPCVLQKLSHFPLSFPANLFQETDTDSPRATRANVLTTTTTRT